MPSFCAVFNCSNRADREKDKSYYRLYSIVRNNGEEGLKMDSSKLQERFDWKKARKYPSLFWSLFNR